MNNKPLYTSKPCSCGNEVVLNSNAKTSDMGFWQDCDCGSTHLFPTVEFNERYNIVRLKSKRQESYDFEAEMKANAERKQRLAAERNEANQKVKKSYKLIK